HGGLKIRHFVVGAPRGGVAAVVIAQVAQMIRDAGIVREKHPTLAGRDEFRRIKRGDGEDCSRQPRSTHGLRDVFDESLCPRRPSERPKQMRHKDYPKLPIPLWLKIV